jgi:hypothetical protein
LKTKLWTKYIFTIILWNQSYECQLGSTIKFQIVINKKCVIDMKLRKPMNCKREQYQCLSWKRSSKKLQKVPKVSKHIQLWIQNNNLEMFQKNLPKVILKQDHDFTKKLKIIKWKNQVLYIYYESTKYNVSYEPLEAKNYLKTISNCFMCCICYQTRKGNTINHIVNCDWTILKIVEYMS